MSDINDFYKNAITSFNPPQDVNTNPANISSITTYKGQVIDKAYLDSHPEIKAFYPTPDEFKERYAFTLKEALPNKKYIIHVSENGMTTQVI